MKLTEEEKEIILAKRKEEEKLKPKKTAIAKANIYTRKDIDFPVDSWFFNTTEKDDCIKEFADTFELAIEKGDSFSCFLEEDGEESWYDNIGYGFENMSSEWAKKYLENIRPIKKNK